MAKRISTIAAARSRSDAFSSPVAGLPATTKTLAALCDRLATSLDAGIAILRVWQSEADRSSGRAKEVYQGIADAIRAGDPLEESVAAAAPYFPPLFIEMTRVGEKTGSLPSAMQRLGKHYESRVKIGREFRSQIAWPLLQLVVALLVVGILIAIGGVLQDGRGGGIDMLGLGLVGARGLTVYAIGLATLTLTAGLGWLALMRRPDWAASLLEQATRLPVVGAAFEKIALARIAWALRLTLDVDMDLRRVVPLSLRASGNRRYSRHGQAVAADIERGVPLSEAFARTGVFPGPFLDALMVSEETGRIVESMDRLSRQYEERAESSMRLLAGVAGGLVWLAVAGLIITLIFRVFGFYTGALNNALEGL